MDVFDSAAESYHWVTSTLTDSRIVFYNFHSIMDETPFNQRPGFPILIGGLISVVSYGVALYFQWQAGILNLAIILGDVVVFGLIQIFWLAFFSQFILPVQTFEERQQIFDRLMGYISGSRGPAIFIKNGRVIERAGENERTGPGVLWLDSASAAVTHANVSFRNTFGPGVHFTDGGERISATVNLHAQSQSIGPREPDLPFDVQGNVSDEEYREIQRRRMMTSAWTRDGIEVVPNISVTFKIDADPVVGDRPGSHFGYNQEAVSRAIINQAVRPNVRPTSAEYNMAWNELPAYLAADLWREYLGHFRLAQLFEQNCASPASIPLENAQPFGQETQASPPPQLQAQGRLADALTDTLRVLNRHFEAWINRYCEQVQNPPAAAPATQTVRPETPNQTALQVINFMLRERMTNPRSPLLNQAGEPQTGWQNSREFDLLRQRGIRVTSVSVSNLRFPPAVEEQFVRRWTANWLANARRERDRIASLRQLVTLTGQERAIREYAAALSHDMVTTDDRKNTLKGLFTRMRDILIRNDRAQRAAASELANIADLLQWLEEN